MTTSQSSGLGGALFTPVQQRVLGLLFGQPDRRFQSAELIRLVGSGTGAVHRQLERLARADLVTVNRSGNQKYYQANRDNPIFPELHSLATKTFGLIEPLRRALNKHARQIRAAFIYGSVGKGTDTGRSDIDLMVISNSLDYPRTYGALHLLETKLGRHVNPTVMSEADWQSKLNRKDSFVSRIAERSRLFVIGTPDDIARA